MSDKQTIGWIMIGLGLAALIMAVTGPSRVRAQDHVGWVYGACYDNGVYFPARPGPICVSADKGISAVTSTLPPPNLTYRVLSGVATSSNIGIGLSPSPKCEDGWSLLLSAGNRPVCARDLREPK